MKWLLHLFGHNWLYFTGDYRKCNICGLRQIKRNGKWEDYRGYRDY